MKVVVVPPHRPLPPSLSVFAHVFHLPPAIISGNEGRYARLCEVQSSRADFVVQAEDVQVRRKCAQVQVLMRVGNIQLQAKELLVFQVTVFKLCLRFRRLRN